jgi:glycerol-3-phosphate dehydrogenase
MFGRNIIMIAIAMYATTHVLTFNHFQDSVSTVENKPIDRKDMNLMEKLWSRNYRSAVVAAISGPNLNS